MMGQDEDWVCPSLLGRVGCSVSLCFGWNLTMSPRLVSDSLSENNPFTSAFQIAETIGTTYHAQGYLWFRMFNSWYEGSILS